MRAVIAGCGRVGARVANSLGVEHDVTIVDWNSASFERLDADFNGTTILGNAIDVDVLTEAGVKGSDAFFALTDVDNRNLMSAQVARSLGAKHVVARVYDASRSQVFEEMGLATFSPTIMGAKRLFAIVTGESEAR